MREKAVIDESDRLCQFRHFFEVAIAYFQCGHKLRPHPSPAGLMYFIAQNTLSEGVL
jgi:hypothetical protein